MSNEAILGSALNEASTAIITVKDEEPFIVFFRCMLYLLALYVAGDIVCGKILRVIPPLVGHIGMGILLGPNGYDFVPSSMVAAWPILGELGLVLMLCQAGLEMDFQVLRAVGPRGAFMALVGSILPTLIGFLLSFYVLELPHESALAVGCSFGPTSAGIALNVLQPCGILKTALGQLIVAIAIVDDIIALVVLSQLKALTADEISASAIAIPIVSALLWLFAGGAVALYVMPIVLSKLTILERNVLTRCASRDTSKQEDNSHHSANSQTQDHYEKPMTSLQLTHIVILLFALLPATYYSQASHLLGAFLAGLSACQQPQAANAYNGELGKIVTWLMRIFFGAFIAFAIPVQLFRDRQVFGTGCLLALSLLGKIMTGPLLTPVHLPQPKTQQAGDGSVTSTTSNGQTSDRCCFDDQHTRDCFVVGFSMAGEAEFAMLVAGFGFSEGLLDEEIYASTVFAILLSTILSPVLLRLTLAFLNVEQQDNNDECDDDQSSCHGLSSNTPVNTTVVSNGDENPADNDVGIEVVDMERSHETKEKPWHKTLFE
ncbi:Na(+)/H [Seminavis robusta]|uniref:Na(+)/H n=1 Tax=Seminavis robusta TaxID=568900 RepID=A0A9N8HQ44_9STRA|nr:Na(+)/H [Seminavis robusta]|eukprot:Sro1132_g244750.1 Na(+)/H (546) ;mRNA; f:13663-15300